MDESIISSSFYVPNILSSKVLKTVKIVTISVGGIILLIGDFLLLFAHSLNSKFLGNDLDYEAISYYVNFGGRQIFYCVNFTIIIIFILAICSKNINLSIIYNLFSIIQIFGRIIWYIALILSIFARTILDIKDEPKKENKGLILITIVFSYEIIYYFFSFIFMKIFIKHLRRHDLKVSNSLNSTAEISNFSNDYSYHKSFFSTANDTLNFEHISWLKSDDYSLKNCYIQNDINNNNNNNSILDNSEIISNTLIEKKPNFSENTNKYYLNNLIKLDYKNSDISWQSDC